MEILISTFMVLTTIFIVFGDVEFFFAVLTRGVALSFCTGSICLSCCWCFIIDCEVDSGGGGGGVCWRWGLEVLVRREIALRVMRRKLFSADFVGVLVSCD